MVREVPDRIPVVREARPEAPLAVDDDASLRIASTVLSSLKTRDAVPWDEWWSGFVLCPDLLLPPNVSFLSNLGWPLATGNDAAALPLRSADASGRQPRCRGKR